MGFVLAMGNKVIHNCVLFFMKLHFFFNAVVQPPPKEPAVQHQLPQTSSPSPGPVPSPSPNPVPIKTTGSEIDPEAFTYSW